ncbi:MAG: DUF2334 domain-containing protein [Candidatus Ratteibacteria bacterium]
MVIENIFESLRFLLRPFEITDYDLRNFVSSGHYNLVADKFYLLKKTFSMSYRDRQYLIVLKKIEKIRQAFHFFSGKHMNLSENSFLIRVDDFPHWEYPSKTFEKFASIFEENEIKFLLGITPQLSKNRHNPHEKNYYELTDTEISLIKKFSTIEIALHGLTHQTLTRSKFHSEFVGLSEHKTNEKIEKGIQILKNFSLNPVAFIPPFDTFEKTNFCVFSQHFKIVCGGYSSAKTFGFYVVPCVLNNSIYIAGYKPFSGTTENILFWMKTLTPLSLIVPVTLHWATEVKDDFSHVKKLAKFLKGKTISWKLLQKIARV